MKKLISLIVKLKTKNVLDTGDYYTLENFYELTIVPAQRTYHDIFNWLIWFYKTNYETVILRIRFWFGNAINGRVIIDFKKCLTSRYC